MAGRKWLRPPGVSVRLSLTVAAESPGEDFEVEANERNV